MDKNQLARMDKHEKAAASPHHSSEPCQDRASPAQPPHAPASQSESYIPPSNTQGQAYLALSLESPIAPIESSTPRKKGQRPPRLDLLPETLAGRYLHSIQTPSDKRVPRPTVSPITPPEQAARTKWTKWTKKRRFASQTPPEQRFSLPSPTVSPVTPPARDNIITGHWFSPRRPTVSPITPPKAARSSNTIGRWTNKFEKAAQHVGRTSASNVSRVAKHLFKVTAKGKGKGQKTYSLEEDSNRSEISFSEAENLVDYSGGFVQKGKRKAALPPSSEPAAKRRLGTPCFGWDTETRVNEVEAYDWEAIDAFGEVPLARKTKEQGKALDVQQEIRKNKRKDPPNLTAEPLFKRARTADNKDEGRGAPSAARGKQKVKGGKSLPKISLLVSRYKKHLKVKGKVTQKQIKEKEFEGEKIDYSTLLTEDEISRITAKMPGLESTILSRSRRRSSHSHSYTQASESSRGPQTESSDKKADKEKSLERNIDNVVFGDLMFKCWYPSWYPKEIIGEKALNGGDKGVGITVPTLYVCKRCFAYSNIVEDWVKHCRLCKKSVPGLLVYTHGTSPWSVWEADGNVDTVSLRYMICIANC